MRCDPTTQRVRANSPSFVLDSELGKYGAELRTTGTVMLPPLLYFSAEELELLEDLEAQIPEERVSGGDDDTHIFVRRILIDKPGEFPTMVNRPYSDQILATLASRGRAEAIAELLGATERHLVRRCQSHRITKGGYVGRHLDIESDPHNEYSVIVQFGRSFAGGEFVVYPPDDVPPQLFSPERGSVIITTCRYQHEVRPVSDGERRSLVYFYARYGGENQRDPSARCSRPDCKWCGPHLQSAVDGS